MNEPSYTRETPRTDLQARQGVVPMEFSRQLEMELNTLNFIIQNQSSVLKHYEKSLPYPDLLKQLAQKDSLIRLLLKYAQHYAKYDREDCYCGFEEAIALAKSQGFDV